MRRLDLHPRKKLRNPGRRLRQLARWPDRIAGSLPDESQTTGERFWNLKVPVFSKLVNPPHATAETRRGCIAAIFAAAEAVERLARRPKGCRVACLVTTPFLFQSEVTLFFDENYFRTFLPVNEAKRIDYPNGWIESEPEDIATIEGFVPPVPAGLEFHGGMLMREFDSMWDRAVERVNWVWAFPRR